jgi:N-acetylglucosaminyldiphosphoundecaprenol N-acetyl-beta-D-mannosaminyltransferase
VRLGEVLTVLGEQVEGGRGGHVLLPGVEQVVLAEGHRALREALSTAELSLAGGSELVRAARALGRPLPVPHAGVEWLLWVAKLARERRWRVFVLAEAPGVAEQAAQALRRGHGVEVVGAASPRVSVELRGMAMERLQDRLAEARPHLVLVAMETPKQELLCQALAARLKPMVFLGAGVALEHLAEELRPVSRWRALAGLGWLGGLLWLLTAPLRLLRRDLAFFRIIRRVGRARPERR